ncbi:MAG: HlyD family type I secretion periplasmic adaptor subunit [Hyphomicrobium sp.]|jgi:HlyD family secretion protein|nr:HlyD family type I secretion periplasmic adaptor subunit [Hyphomicrobium sp.]PPD07332.1 MAG: hemolysin secretion protein D [Hyphomicrobium sp.]
MSRPQRIKVEVAANVRGYIAAGLAVLFFLVGGLGVWAASTTISGAVIGSGLVVVESNVKKVQHPSGGIVGEILVKNGSTVKAGDVLIRLDETLTRTNEQMISKQLDQLLMREARLKAERDGSDIVTVPAILASRTFEADVAEIVNGEQSLFTSRRESQAGQLSQLKERVGQLTQESEGITAQIDAKTREIKLIADELAGLAGLEAKQLVTTAKLAALKREQARLEGELGQYEAALAQTSGRRTEVALQMARLDQEMKTEVVNELRDAQTKIAEFVERKIAAADQLRRVDIRAPQDGIVHQLAVFTVGGVINPGEQIMLIVPQDDKLLVEAKIAPQDIDQVRVGMQARLRFSAFSQQTTPQIVGEVVSISPDLTRDQITGDIYFTARISMPDAERAKLGTNKLQPGIPVEVHITTEERTALSYLVKPMADQINRAFRER